MVTSAELASESVISQQPICTSMDDRPMRQGLLADESLKGPGSPLSPSINQVN